MGGGAHSKPNNHAQQPHVVSVTPWKIVNSSGGAEKVFCDMSIGLVNNGYDVTSIFFDNECGPILFDVSPGFGDDRVFPWWKKGKGLLKNLLSLSLNKDERNKKRQKFRDFYRKKVILETLKNLPAVDVFISHHYQITNLLVKEMKVRAPVITMLHGEPNYYIEEKEFKEGIEALEKSRVIQVLLPEYINQVRAVLRKPEVVCIPNAIPCSSEQSILTEKKIITVARIEEGKRTDLLVDAFALIKDKYPEWKCEWWGDEGISFDYMKSVREKINKHHLEDRFLLCGRTSDVLGRLCKASIFAFPSRFEGFSLAVGEAFSVGLPVVGCDDCLFMKSMIKDGENGLLE